MRSIMVLGLSRLRPLPRAGEGWGERSEGPGVLSKGVSHFRFIHFQFIQQAQQRLEVDIALTGAA